MKYLCKKSYNCDFTVGEYYMPDEVINDSVIMINGIWFFKFNDYIKTSTISDYFESESEIRRKKLKKISLVE